MYGMKGAQWEVSTDVVVLTYCFRYGFYLNSGKARVYSHVENFGLQVCATKVQIFC